MSGWLIVGLGNPGPQYAKTRHNLGFMLVDRLAAAANVQVKRDECKSLVGRCEISGAKAELAKPQTYMNLSGEAVSCLTAKDGRTVDRLIIISDDLAIPFGTVRIRPRGSHGGQNGLRSIIDRLGTQDFIRLRIGIQPEHPVGDAARFVLDNFSKQETGALESILDESADAISTIVIDGVEAAMARFN